MNIYDEIRIEALDSDSDLFVLLDKRGKSLGTGSLEALEVLLYIARQCDEKNLYYGRRWETRLPLTTAITLDINMPSSPASRISSHLFKT